MIPRYHPHSLIRWALLIQPATLHQLLDHVVELACQFKVTRGRKLRIDGTVVEVVETNIHAPTDSSLLNDGVRVISRLLKSAHTLLSSTVEVAGEASAKLFRDRTRTAKRLNKQIIDTLRSHGRGRGRGHGDGAMGRWGDGAEQLRKMVVVMVMAMGRWGDGAEQLRKAAYEHLVKVGQAMLDQAKAVGKLLDEAMHGTMGRKSRQTNLLHACCTLAARLKQSTPLLQAVLEQTKRRVLRGERVAASEKLVSIFEPQTAIIRKGKLSKPTEYGRMVWLDEAEGEIISRFEVEVLVGNPADQEQVQPKPSLQHHKQLFKRPPKLLAADRSCWSQSNETMAEAEGVEQVCLPKPGVRSEERKVHERQGWFVRGCNWRGGEGVSKGGSMS